MQATLMGVGETYKFSANVTMTNYVSSYKQLSSLDD